MRNNLCQKPVYGAFIILSSFILFGCATSFKMVTVPPGESADHPPVITVNAISYLPASLSGSAGNIEKPQVISPSGTTTVVSNIDNNTYIQFSALATNGLSPATTGGVQSLTFTIIQNGTTIFSADSTGVKVNNMAPNSLNVVYNGKTAIQFQIAATPITVNATATNFNGGTTNLTVIYVPLDPMQRNKDLGPVRLILNPAPGQNIYSAVFPIPIPGVTQPNGYVHYINGPTDSQQPVILLNSTTTECANPATSVILQPFGNLYSTDMTKLFGTQTPPFPVTIRACSNPNVNLPGQMDVMITYRYN
jgi:hypothetical protein